MVANPWVPGVLKTKPVKGLGVRRHYRKRSGNAPPQIVEPCAPGVDRRLPTEIDLFLDMFLEDARRTDLLQAQKLLLMVLTLFPDGLTTPELMYVLGIRGVNRKQLQRTCDHLLHRGEIEREVLIGDEAAQRHHKGHCNRLALYRRKL